MKIIKIIKIIKIKILHFYIFSNIKFLCNFLKCGFFFLMYVINDVVAEKF